MLEFLTVFVVGVVLIVIGILNRKGNVSMLHSYHRKRVSEEDELPFGKMVGLGTIIMGASMCVAGGFLAIDYFAGLTIFSVIGGVTAVVGFIVGLAIAFKAMIKYNKGIF